MLVVLGPMSLATNEAHTMLVAIWGKTSPLHVPRLQLRQGYISTLFDYSQTLSTEIGTTHFEGRGSAMQSRRKHLHEEWRKLSWFPIIEAKRLLLNTCRET